MNPTDIDTWTEASFEDAIARAMTALYETTLDERSMAHALNAITAQDLLKVRQHGVFIPAADRLVWGDGEDDHRQLDDQVQIPTSGCLSLGEDRGNGTDDAMTSYCRIEYFRRITKLPFSQVPTGPGLPYEVIRLFPQNRTGVEGTRNYVMVHPTTRRLYPCLQRGMGRQEALKRAMSGESKTELSLNYAMQFIDDQRHQWGITALGEGTKVTVGAYAENVKSLLYARTLPMTPTGRKRPILHLVHAHQRRLKEGTDIDIQSFLRGTREITMDGTVFKVHAPEALIDRLLAEKSR